MTFNTQLSFKEIYEVRDASRGLMCLSNEISPIYLPPLD